MLCCLQYPLIGHSESYGKLDCFDLWTILCMLNVMTVHVSTCMRFDVCVCMVGCGILRESMYVLVYIKSENVLFL